MLGLTSIILIFVVGFGIVAAIIGVVVVIAISRRNDYVNPLPIPKPHSENVSPTVPKNVPSHLYSAPATDQETALVDWLVAQASAQTRVDLSADPVVRDRLLNAARIALDNLQTQETTQIILPFLAADPQGPKHFEMTFTRAMRDQLY